MPKVDILLATYNGEAFIREQIDSLLVQTHSNLQIIIRDDGSTDSTREIVSEYVKQFPGKIQVVFDGENLGPQQNFLKLMWLSQSDYIMFCDQDDVWKKDKIEKSLFAIQQLEKKHGKATPLLIHTDLCVVDQDLKELSSSFWDYTRLNPKNDSFNRILVQNMVTGCTVLMNRPLLELSLKMPKEALMHDWWVALVASAFGKIGFLNESTIYYRQHGKNQIGASRYSFLSLVKKGLVRLKANFWKREINFSVQKNQVEAFNALYKNQLNLQQQKMLETYLALPFTSYFKARYQVMKFRFFRSGFARNIGLFLISKQP